MAAAADEMAQLEQQSNLLQQMQTILRFSKPKPVTNDSTKAVGLDLASSACPGPYLLEPVGFSTPAGRIAYQAYAAFEAGSDTYRVLISGETTDDARWCEREITYALAGGEAGWVEKAETAIPLSTEQKEQILEAVRAEVQTAWAQLREAVTGGPNSSGPSDEAD